ncbi:MAG: oligosaccharide flippase family protein [Planctomycetota bacterium]
MDETDQSTSEGRSVALDTVAEPFEKHRNRRIRLGTLGAGLSRVGGLLVTLIAIPWAVDGLSELDFGLWITITAFFSMMSFVDGGMGNALINLVAEHTAANDRRQLNRSISSAYAGVAVAALFGFSVVASAIRAVDWKTFFDLPSEVSSAIVVSASTVAAFLFFVQMPLGLAWKIQQGLQASHRNALFSLLSSLSTIAGTALAWYCQAGLLGFLVGFGCGPVVGHLANTIYVWLANSSHRPAWKSVSLKELRCILKLGGMFWGLQLGFAIAFQSDIVIVSKFVGLREAGEFGVAQRLFLMAGGVTSLILTPLWPAFRDAAIRGHYTWIQAAFSKNLCIIIVASLSATIPLAVCFGKINLYWTGSKIQPSSATVYALCMWTSIMAVGQLMSTVLNGLQELKSQLSLTFVMAAVNILLSIALASRYGACGVTIASIVTYSLIMLGPYYLMIRRAGRTVGEDTKPVMCS